MFDLEQYDFTAQANEGVEIELYDPASGKGLGVFITVCGMESDAWREAQMALQNKRLAMLRKGSRNKVELTAEDLEEEGIGTLAACTVSWRKMGKGGTELPCTKENVLDVYRRYNWIRKQVDEAIGDSALFFGKRSKD